MQVYATLTAAQIISKVANEGLRPPVPKACPWAAVMQACWREDPEQRPPFSEILPELQRIEQTLPRPPAGAAATIPGPWATATAPALSGGSARPARVGGKESDALLEAADPRPLGGERRSPRRRRDGDDW